MKAHYLALCIIAAGCSDIEKAGDDWPLAENSAENPQLEAVPGPEAERELFTHPAALLDGRWTEQNVGCVAQWVWNDFQPSNLLVASEETYATNESGDDGELWRTDGDWSIDEHGTVEWSYEYNDYAQTRRQTLAVVNGPLMHALTWAGSDDGIWPSGAYAPHTADLKTFRSVEYRASELSDGSLYETGTTVDLQLSASPDELAAGAACHMTLTGIGLDGTEARFDGPCVVSESGYDGVLAIHGVDYTADWGAASQQWREQLEADDFYASSDASHVVDPIRIATTPVLLFDPGDPTVLARPYGMSVLGRSAP